MVLDCRPLGVGKSSGSRPSNGFFTPEGKHSGTDYIGAYADGLFGRRERRVTKDDMCIDLNRLPFTTAQIATENDGSSSSRSSSRTGESGRSSHTSFEQELSGEPYSPAIAEHRGRVVPYPTPQPTSKPQTPVRNIKMQRFSSLSGVDLSNLPPTPDSLQSTPSFGYRVDRLKRRMEASPEIPSVEDVEFEEKRDQYLDPASDEDESEGDEWEDVEEEEDGDTDNGDNEGYETINDAFDDHEIDSGDSTPERDEVEEEEEEEDSLLHFGRGLSPSDKNTDEDLAEDGIYTPKLRAKLEASPQILPILEAATASSSPSPPPPPISSSSLLNASLPITNPSASPLPSTESPLLVNRTFKLTSHKFSCPSSPLSPPSSSSSSPSSSILLPPSDFPSLSTVHHSSLSANDSSSFSGTYSSDPAVSYPSGELSNPQLDSPFHSPTTTSSPPAPPLLHAESDFTLRRLSVSSISSAPSVSHLLESIITPQSGLSVNRSTDYPSGHCSGSSIHLFSNPSLDTSLQSSLNLSPAISPTEKLDEMPPFIRTVKTATGVSLSCSMERQLPRKTAEVLGIIPEAPAEMREYAFECIWSADAGRMSPWNLHEGEYKVLRDHLNQLHVTTYLNIRNGILRLWLKNSKQRVTREQARGCCKEERFYGLADVALVWLTRSGFINHGCLEIPTNSSTARKPGARRRKTIAVIGAGISGLATARQLEALLASSGECLGGVGAPDVVVFEGRHRLGGRVYSAALAPGSHNLPDGLEPAVDIGGQIVMGYDARNPLAALIVDQLGIPFHTIGKVFPIHDYDGRVIEDGRDTFVEVVHNDILTRIAAFSYKEPPPMTAHGDVKYITKCKDPWGVGGPPLSVVQGGGYVAPPSDSPPDERKESREVREFRAAAEALKIEVAKGYGEDGLASLGKTMDGVFPGYAGLLKTDARDVRLYNWFQANLEYGNAAAVDRSSLEHWDQDDGYEPSGAHTMIMGGYGQLAKGLSSTPSQLDVRLDHRVKRVKYDPNNKKKGVTLQFADSSEFTADKVIVTLPLGVLKEGCVEFDPPLPEAKQDAIDRLGFGLLNKVIMVYEEAFWNTENAGFGCLRKPEAGEDETLLSSYEKKRGRFYIWWNTTDVVGRPTLVGLMVGDAAEQVEEEETEEVIKEATAILKKCWGEDKVPDRPKECVVTRWRHDPFAFGSYSYVATGSTGADYDTIAEPINDQIFFAGEHTSRKYPATVHGAYISGLRVAGEVAESVLGPIQVPSPLIGPRALKSKTEATITSSRTLATRINHIAAQEAKTKSVRTLKTTKIQRDNSSYRVSTTTAVVQRSTKRKAADEVEYKTPVKKARAHPPKAELPQRKRKRMTVKESGPEAEVRPKKKARAPNAQAEPQNIAPIDPKPEEPKKKTGNPFLIYQKDFFKTAQNRANQTKREQTGIPDAKADRNEVRIVLGSMWTSAPADIRQRYLDQANQNKQESRAILNNYKRQLAAWESRQATTNRNTAAPTTLPAPAPTSAV